ncbi:MAG: hypothetical protein NW237_06000 [Cyanobacteriota bacterium]|nr:hypothetical protein [Cyanobacteriota bacterium]
MDSAYHFLLTQPDAVTDPRFSSSHTNSSASLPTAHGWQPIDRWVAGVTGFSLIILSCLVFLGFYAPPQVRDFNWQEQRVTAQDRQLVLTFNRPMDGGSVEDHFQISPALPGRSHWLGYRFIYTLDQPAPYGQVYQVRLEGARDQRGREMTQPFQGAFRTPDRQLLLIGATGEAAGRLLLFNLETGSQSFLTAADQKVTQVQVAGDGDTIFYFATLDTLQNQDLYQFSLRQQTTTLLLDHQAWQNLRLENSPDGTLLIVERISRENPGEIRLWSKALSEQRFRLLDLTSDGGGDFLITPDNTSLLMAQGQGLSILPLDSSVAGSAADFLPQFGQAIAMQPDGSHAALVAFNPDYTRSLWIVSNTGRSQSVLTTDGGIVAGRFSPDGEIFYCLTHRRNPDYTESPLLLALHWQTQHSIPLVEAEFPTQLEFSLSPDGRSLVYSRLQPSEGIPNPRAPLSKTGQAIANSQIYRLDLTQDPPTPQPLPPAGVNPVWIP